MSFRRIWITCLLAAFVLSLGSCGGSKTTGDKGKKTAKGGKTPKVDKKDQANKKDQAKTKNSAGQKTTNKSTTAKKSTNTYRGTIGVSVLTLDNPFFKIIGDAITAEADRHGYKTVVVSGDMDIARQSDQVKNFIVQKVSAIVLCPCDSKTVAEVIREANKARIPVFTTDIACLDKTVKVESHIATDNYMGGKQAGDAMIEALGDEGGEVVILHYRKAESCLLRVQGFREVIDTYNKNRKQGKIDIKQEFPCKGERTLGYESTQAAITNYPNMKGIFAINDPAALGARAALEKNGIAEKVKIIGFDGQRDGKIAIRDGKIYADPIQFPRQMGIKTVQQFIKYLKGETLEPELLIPTKLYRKKDGEADPDLKKAS